MCLATSPEKRLVVHAANAYFFRPQQSKGQFHIRNFAVLLLFRSWRSLQPGNDFIDGFLPTDKTIGTTEHNLMGMWIHFLFGRRHIAG